MPRWTNSPETDLGRPTWGYWIAQAATWSIWFTTWLFYWIGKKPITFKLICVGLTLAATFFALSHVFRSVIHRRGWLNLRVPQLGWRVLVSCLVLAVLVQVIVDPIYVYLFRVTSWTEELSRQTIILYTFDGTITFYFWSVFHIAFSYVRVVRASEVERWRLESALQASELRALKSQVNPHFLFNCLNNLRSLVVEDPERARDMMLRLSELLRYALEVSNHERVTLETELEVVHAYLDLESLQFENRLSWTIEVSDESRSALLPPLILQHLVENAIKHGISKSPNGGNIGIRAKLERGNLVLDVENTGQLATASGGLGTGLNNARERLRLLSGELAKLTLVNRDHQHVAAVAVIPL